MFRSAMFRAPMTQYETAYCAILSGSHAVSPRGVVYSFLAGVPERLTPQSDPDHKDPAPFVVSRLPGANRRHRLYVHQLIAVQYLGPRPAGLKLRHLDDDRTNARLSNLAYGTDQQNRDDRKRNEKRRAAAAAASRSVA